jgi:uncharacterized protein
MSEQYIFFKGALDEVDGKLVQMGHKCKDCDKTSYPAVERCIFCGSENVQKVNLSEIGTVFTHSITRVPVGPFKPPFIGAYIDLPEGARVFGQIHAGIDEVKDGMKVKVETGVIWTDKDGKEATGFFYVPYKDGGAES